MKNILFAALAAPVNMMKALLDYSEVTRLGHFLILVVMAVPVIGIIAIFNLPFAVSMFVGNFLTALFFGLTEKRKRWY